MLSPFKIIEFHSPHDFLDHLEPLLLKNETYYNLKLGVAAAIKKQTMNFENTFFLGIYESDQLIGGALRSNLTTPIAITDLPKVAIDLLVNYLMEKNITLSGVVGKIEAATFFKDQWTYKNKIESKLHLHLGVYETSKIIKPNLEGYLVTGTQKESETIFNFIKGFMTDCFPESKNLDETSENLKQKHIANESLFLLKNKNDEVLAMAANSRSSLNAGTISLVYTPCDFRGKGYGSLVTALLSEHILTQKKMVNLFTDLSNPISNSIYQKIGFNMIGENIHFDFDINL